MIEERNKHFSKQSPWKEWMGKLWKYASKNGGLWITFIIWMMGVAFFLFTVPFFIGVDTYFHVRLATQYHQIGWILSEFPWAYASLWSTHWFDKEWLFHIFMIPFVTWNEKLGTKLFILITNCGLFFTLFICLRSLGCRLSNQWYWILSMFGLSYGIFWVRLVECRPHLFSLIFMFLGWSAMFTSRPKLAGGVAFLYTLSYTGSWQVLGHYFLFDLLSLVCRIRKIPSYFVWSFLGKSVSFWGILGVLIGTCIHPNFPKNLYGLYVQNVLTLWDAWFGFSPTIISGLRPMELEGLGKNIVFWAMPLLVSHIFFLIWIGVLFFRQQIRSLWNPILLFLLGASFIYLGMSLLSHRFLEYAVPVTTVLIIFICQHYCQSVKEILPKKSFWVILLLIVWLYGGLGYRHFYRRYVIEQSMIQGNQDAFFEIGDWLGKHLPSGTRIFCPSWSVNSFLWYHAPHLSYPYFLDPIFMVVAEEKRYYQTLKKIIEGIIPYYELPLTISQQFKSPIAIIPRSWRFLQIRLEDGKAQALFCDRLGNKVYLLDCEYPFGCKSDPSPITPKRGEVIK